MFITSAGRGQCLSAKFFEKLLPPDPAPLCFPPEEISICFVNVNKAPSLSFAFCGHLLLSIAKD